MPHSSWKLLAPVKPRYVYGPHSGQTYFACWEPFRWPYVGHYDTGRPEHNNVPDAVGVSMMKGKQQFCVGIRPAHLKNVVK